MHSVGRVQLLRRLGIVAGCISGMSMHSCWDTEVS